MIALILKPDKNIFAEWNVVLWHSIQSGCNQIFIFILFLFSGIVLTPSELSMGFVFIILLINVAIGLYSIFTNSKKKLLITGKLAEKIYTSFN